MSAERKVWTAEEFEEHLKRAAFIAAEGMMVDGSHHKQWFLGQIIIELGYDLDDLIKTVGIEVDRGIAPWITKERTQ